jgi:ABC-type dipeptide/oligopeptide/nickel transport system permease component
VLRYAAARLATFPLPGSPVFSRLRDYQTPQMVAELTQRLGLDRPLTAQYGDFLSGLTSLDLGTSFQTSNPVSTDLAELFPATLELALASLLVALVFGVTFGVVSGLRARGPVARASSTYRLVAGAVPEFLIGLVLIYVFVAVLGIAPGPTGQLDAQLDAPPRVTGMIVIDALLAGDGAVLRSALAHLALPALALGFSAGGPIARLLHVVIAEARQSDYVQYAELCGLRRRTVVLYVMRSTVTPLITLLAVLSVILIGQSVPVEVVFSWGGLGQYTVQAVLISDYPAVQGVVIVTTTFVLTTYLLADLLQAVLDPRLDVSRPVRARPRWATRAAFRARRTSVAAGELH